MLVNLLRYAADVRWQWTAEADALRERHGREQVAPRRVRLVAEGPRVSERQVPWETRWGASGQQTTGLLFFANPWIAQ